MHFVYILPKQDGRHMKFQEFNVKFASNLLANETEWLT